MAAESRRFRAMIFDLDGTLIDSLADIGNAANVALKTLGYPQHALDRYRVFVGDGVHVLFERALAPAAATTEQITALAKEFAKAYASTWHTQTKLYPGIPEVLDQLTARGTRLGILSNKPEGFTQKCAAHFCQRWPFAVIAGQRDNVARKPSPEGAILIADQLGLPPSEIAFVGDTSVDMETAVRAGMFAIGVDWGFRPAAELWAHGANVVLSCADQILRFA